jgi:Uncharacterized conserved protein
MPIDARVLGILACPDNHHAPLAHDPVARTLTCTGCGRVYEIGADEIPVLLLDEARTTPAPEGES